LATGAPVIAIGGFNGSDPAPTLAQFQEWVAAGRIHYYIPGGGFGGRPGAQGGSTQMGGADVASEISSWVQANYTATTVGATTVYDLTQGFADSSSTSTSSTSTSSTSTSS
jgi:hypothetical protein